VWPHIVVRGVVGDDCVQAERDNGARKRAHEVGGGRVEVGSGWRPVRCGSRQLRRAYFVFGDTVNQGHGLA
jgi:hypothetical protein